MYEALGRPQVLSRSLTDGTWDRPTVDGIIDLRGYDRNNYNTANNYGRSFHPRQGKYDYTKYIIKK